MKLLFMVAPLFIIAGGDEKAGVVSRLILAGEEFRAVSAAAPWKRDASDVREAKVGRAGLPKKRPPFLFAWKNASRWSNEPS